MQKPKYVNVQQKPTARFTVNLVPKLERGLLNPPPASPAAGETPSPISPALLTPPNQAGPSGINRSRDLAKQFPSDWGVPLKQEEGPEGESSRPQKRARWAFDGEDEQDWVERELS
jgi:hypothetical protein